MDKMGALFVFYVCGGLGSILISIGIGSIYTEGVGFIAAGVCSIILIPGGILFNNHIDKFIRD